MPTLCATFRKQAAGVWNNTSKAAAKGLWLSEETITEWVQYNIAIAHQGSGFVVDLATKPQEHKHGGDWEWWFVKGKKAYGFRVQAKRLFSPDYRYRSLFKSGPNPYSQLDKLEKRAAKDGLIPLYCFYNFGHDPSVFGAMANTCSHRYRQPSFWGCSIAFPDVVKSAGSSELSKLKSLMSPWHTLVCRSNRASLITAVGDFVRERAPDRLMVPRKLPARITRLIEMNEARRDSAHGTDVNEAYWDAVGKVTPKTVSGVVVYRDTRKDGS